MKNKMWIRLSIFPTYLFTPCAITSCTSIAENLQALEKKQQQNLFLLPSLKILQNVLMKINPILKKSTQ